MCLPAKRVIRFSSDYLKLPKDVKEAKLLLVLRTTKKKLPECFILYDSYKRDGSYYPIPDGELLLLLFQAVTKLQGRFFVFTTLRRRNLRKEQYYRKHIGEWFKVQVTNL